MPTDLAQVVRAMADIDQGFERLIAAAEGTGDLALAAIASKAIGRSYADYALSPNHRAIIDAMTTADCRASCMQAVRAEGAIPYHAKVVNTEIMRSGVSITEKVLEGLDTAGVDTMAMLAAAGMLIVAYARIKMVSPSVTLDAMPQIISIITEMKKGTAPS